MDLVDYMKENGLARYSNLSWSSKENERKCIKDEVLQYNPQTGGYTVLFNGKVLNDMIMHIHVKSVGEVGLENIVEST